MTMLSVIGIALCATFLSLLLKRHHPEFSVAVSIAASVVLFFSVSHHFLTLKEALNNMALRCNLSPKLLVLLYKVVGTAYLGQFAGSLCRDAGETALAGILEFCTKITILLMSLPLMTSLFETLIHIAESI